MEISFERDFLQFEARRLSRRRATKSRQYEAGRLSRLRAFKACRLSRLRAFNCTKSHLYMKFISASLSIPRSLRSQLMGRFYDKMSLVAVSLYVFDEEEVSHCGGKLDVDTCQRGSGFLISKDGQIITASHVIRPEGGTDTESEDSDEEITVAIFIVRANDPTRFERCRLVFDDIESDVAIIQVNNVAEKYDFCKFVGNREDITMGMEVMSIADSARLPFSFAMGRVSLPSLVHRNLLPQFRGPPTGDEVPLVRLHIHSYRGASGGPVFDSRGCVIGMISFGSRHNVYIVPFWKLNEVRSRMPSVSS